MQADWQGLNCLQRTRFDLKLMYHFFLNLNFAGALDNQIIEML